MPLAPTTTLSELHPTHRRCLNCGDLITDISWDSCEQCGGEDFEFLHISDTALGYDDDSDFLVAARGAVPDRWEYYAREPA